MAEVGNREAPETRRLVLGFDAGCMTCSDLARRIEEKVDDKLEVRSLRDPQVEEWRRRALGEDAPWAPTLIEVKGIRVRAWTGWQLGINLSRFLGPVATWRVMQALGEAGAVPAEADGSPAARAVAAGLSRGQFLRGAAAGAAVAASMLAGGTTLLPSLAEAADEKKEGSGGKNSKGSPSDREKAERIVKNSKWYKQLATEQENATKVRSPLEIVDTEFRDRYAVVRVRSNRRSSDERGVIAYFGVDVKAEKVLAYSDTVITKDVGNDDKDQRRIKFRSQGKVRERVLGTKEHVITEDGRKMRWEEYRKDVRQRIKDRKEDRNGRSVDDSARSAQYEPPDFLGVTPCEAVCQIAFRLPGIPTCVGIGVLTGGIGGAACGVILFATSAYFCNDCEGSLA